MNREISIVRFLLFFIFISSQIWSLSSISAEEGPRPSNFCVPKTFRNIQVDLKTLDGSILFSQSKFNTDGSISSVVLTDGSKKYLSSQLWLQSKVNLQNGFETQFSMDISKIGCRASSCKAGAMYICTYETKSSCGGDGFAFVVQASDAKFKGAAGSGLGYSNVMSSVAVEFDAVANQGKNDPSTDIERHISLIAVNGQNLADELNALARNEKPANFKNQESSNFIPNPTIKIQFLNNNWRVFINDVLQLGYYSSFPYRKFFPTSPETWVGITASTSDVNAAYKVTSWRMSVVIPSIANSVAKLTNENNQIKSKEDFTIDIVLKDECGNIYIPVDGYDDLSQADFDKSSVIDCDLRDKLFSQDPASGYAIRFKFNCANVGKHTFSFKYQGQSLNQVNVNIMAGAFSRAALNFPWGTQGTIDTGIQFYFVPYDFSKNIVDVSNSVVLSKLNIVFPTSSGSSKNFQLTKQADNTYLVKFTSDTVGNYYIQDQVFIYEVASGRYDFSLIEGEFNAEKSTAFLMLDHVDVNSINPSTVLTDTSISAGTKLTLRIDYKDRVGNYISSSRIQVANMNNLKYIDGKSEQITNMLPGALTYYSYLTVEKAGQYSLKTYYKNQEIKCTNCIFTVIPLAADFGHSSLFQFDFLAGKYNTQITDNFVVNKGDPFNFQLLLRDVYDNIVSVGNVKAYASTLNGNKMKDLQLVLSTVEKGIKLEVNAGDLDYYRNLVGRKNYVITVVQDSTKASKTWNLEIKSDGSDSDSGNSDLDPIRSSLTWTNPLQVAKGLAAGVTTRAVLILKNKEGLRYNGWLDESELPVSLTYLDEAKGEKLFPLKKGEKKGIYYIDLLTTVALGKINTLTVIIKTVAKKLMFKTVAADGYLGFPHESAINSTTNEFLEGTVNKEYNFTFMTYDKYNNPQDVASTNIVFKSKEDETKSFPVTCKRADLGFYACLLTVSFPGKYSVESNYIANTGKSYSAYFRRGAPSAKTSVATVVEDVSLGKEAGSIVTIKITVKDESGLSLTKDEVLEAFDGFKANVKEPGLSTYSEISPLNVQSNGDILGAFKLTRAGLNVFSASFNNTSLKCLVCSVNVYATDVDLTRIKMFYLSISTAGNVENALSDKTAFMIQNTKVDPIFIMRFSDKYGNKRNYTEDLEFSGNLNVPNGAQQKYTLESAGWGDAIKFIISDAQIKYFHSELKNENCTGIFRATDKKSKNSGESVSKLFLTGGDDDDIYSNDDIDPNSSKVAPTSLKFVAGEWVDLNIELRTANARLYNHPLTFGWYENPESSFQMKLSDGETITGGVKPGKLKGTYTIHFTSYKSYINGTTLTIHYMDPKTNTTFIPITQKVKLIVQPAALNYLVLSDPSLISDDIAGKSKTLTFFPYDKFRNLIPKLSLTAMNFNIASSANENIVPNILQNSDGGVVVTYTVNKVSTIVITAIKFKDQGGTTVSNYTYNIGPAETDAIHSIATLDRDIINAGEFVFWKIFPRDKYDNTAPVSKELLSLFSASRHEPQADHVIPIVDDPEMGSDETGNYYFWKFNLTLAGTHEFKAYVGEAAVSSNKFRCTVNALVSDFLASTLGLYQSLTGQYNAYDGNHFEQNIAALPDFKVLLFDRYKNPVNKLPATWDLTLYLTSDELGSKYGISFCRENDRVTFKMCQNNSLQPDLIAPAKRWADLIVPKNYSLMLSNGLDQHPNFTLEIIGNATDDDASNLPVDIQNTIFSPVEVHTDVNVATSFQIFIMTTNKNLRRNEWFENPSEAIKLIFAQNDGNISYSIAYGEKKGIYKATVTSKIAYPVKPNEISAKITNILVQNKNVKLFVNPGKPDIIYPYDSTNKKILNSLPTLTVDDKFLQGFIAKDKYGNVIDLNLDTPGANSIVNGPNGETISHNKNFPIDSELMVIDFQPKLPGTYKITFNEKSIYEFKVTQGSINFEQSTAAVSPAKQVAGERVNITITPRDQFGNLLQITNTSAYKYFVALPSDSNTYIAGSSTPIIVDGTSVTFTEIVIYKGYYTFKTSIDGNAVTMALSRVLVKPAQVSLKHSLLQYYDTTLMKYANADRESPIKEDNLKTYPRYLLFLADRFGNRYDEFPKELQNSFTVVLFGNDYKESSPVHYDADQLQGNALYITVDDADKQRYQNGIFETTPYNLSISLSDTKETVYYPITLLGEGSDDNDASIEIPLDITKTFLSKNVLSYTAGKSDNFMIELRTKLGTRKADIGTPTFTFKFAQADNLEDGKFAASFIPGDLRGRFIITVTGTKANKMIGPTILTITVNGLTVPKTINVTVVPGDLHHADLINNKDTISADLDYTFSIIPRDIYENIPLVKPQDLNIVVTFPIGSIGAHDYAGEVDFSNNHVHFVVKNRYAGLYNISSQFLKSSANFTVVPGAPNAKYTLVSVAPNKLRAGEAVSVTITPFDSYNNQIKPLSSRGKECLESTNINSVLGADITSQKLSVDEAKDVLRGSFVYTKVGLVSVVVNVKTVQVICDTCSVTYIPAALNLTMTKFFTVSTMGVNKTNKATFEAGRTDLRMLAELYDKYENAIQEITDVEEFSLVMSGNNMDSMSLNVAKHENATNSLDFSVVPEKAAEFSRLVPADNYKLTLTYLYNKKVNQTADLFMQLTGEDNGGGNGKYVLNMTYVNPLDLNLSAGEEGTVVIELRTSENKRFNGFFDINKLLSSETAESFSNNDTLNMNFFFGEYSGNYRLSLKSFKSMPAGKKKLVQISIDGQVLSNKLISVFITPSVPDMSKTIVTVPIPFTLYSGKETETRVKLFDSYNNPFVLPEWTTKITGQATSGQAIFGATVFDAKTNEYVVKLKALYPPRLVVIQLYFLKTEGRSFPILQIPSVSQILTEIDTKSTKLTGEKLGGVPIGQDLDFNILLLDTFGYCYETTKSVQISLTGPFKLNKAGVDDVVDGATAVSLQPVISTLVPATNDTSKELTVNGIVCNKYYSAKVYGNQIQIAGYYQIDVYLPDYGKNIVISQRTTYMSAGPISPTSSLISLKGVTLTNPEKYDLPVNTPVVVRLQLRDAFKNVISSSSSLKYEFAFADGSLKPDTDYKLKDLSKGDGFIDLELTFFKVGNAPTGQYTFQGKTVLWSSLDKFNFPNSIAITPGVCSSTVPSIDNAQLLSKGASIGTKANFVITCLDAFSNLVGKGGDKFTVQIIGTEIETAKSETIPTNVLDRGNGEYLVDFIPQWPGTYTVTVQLNGNNYAPSWSFTAKGGVCPGDKPFICVNNNQCVASYKECGYDDLSCPTTTQPISCVVGGAAVCVKKSTECDCKSAEEIKCNSDQKCVGFMDVDTVCGTSGQNPGLIQCPDSANFICPDGSCRINEHECPATAGCPPQYRLCVDLTCALKNSTCQYRAIEQCPFDKFYRCDDFSCVADPTLCPTKITCPKPGMILCPDKKCVDSELQCGQVPKCSADQVLCSDTSCAANYESCPTGIVCPIGKALCTDGSCKDSCTTGSTSRLLFRILRALEGNQTSTCSANKTYCAETGACVDSAALCPTPTPVTCAQDEKKCSSMVCVKNSEECPNIVCPEGQIQCWDNSCADDLTECPTKISCPSKYPRLCSDGSCVSESTNCPSAIKCKRSRPFKCGSGDCRKTLADCPTQVTCPQDHPVRCQDGSCVSNKEFCTDNIENSKCAADQVRCGDGSCAESSEKCSTMPTCLKGQLRCWDNKCVDKLSDCSKLEATDEVCSSKTPVNCPDGSCAKTIQDCPTGVICPEAFPIKCEDGNCRRSRENCLPYTHCPDGKMNPDGTCFEKGTTVTCSSKEPYKCFDGTCRNHPFNCPDYAECPNETPILCSSGACVSDRSECPIVKKCNVGEVLCPDFSCKQSADLCHRQQGCPTGTVLCSDDTCMPSERFCRAKNCPANLPFVCKDGFCVSDLKYCDTDDGCPFLTPFKCNNGLCTKSEADCPSNNTYSCPNKGDYLCPDGSCSTYQRKCPLKNGCPAKKPQRCSEGKCVDPSKERCPPVRCPKETPVRCNNGLCMSSKQACSSIYNPEIDSHCQNGTFFCADGRCVPSLDQCRPVHGCGKLNRCGDGSCVLDKRTCPLVNNTCPAPNTIRCDNGACVSDEKDCIEENGCPAKYSYKCAKTGLCAKNESDCDAQAKKVYLTNGCPVITPYLEDGKCVEQPKNTTSNQTNATKCENGSVACANGTCVKNMSECFACPKGHYRCSDQTCKPNHYSCPNRNGCPKNKPFKCGDGSCVGSFKDLSNRCKPHLPCLDDPDKYLCADGNCEMSSDNCRVLFPCPNEQIRCSDLSCAASLANCPSSAICPPTSSIRCPSGKCVDTIEECNENVCPEITCVSGYCANSSAYCVSATQRSGSAARILANATIDGGCTSDAPYLCGDGSCQANKADCGYVSGCSSPKAPYRCWDGLCAENSTYCSAEEKCSNGKRCEDGICREVCPEFDGCSLSTPFQCPNGLCAVNSNSCEKVCADNKATNALSDCSRFIRTLTTQSLEMTVDSNKESTTLSYITDGKTSSVYGELLIPQAALSNGSQYSILRISSVAFSTVNNTDTLQSKPEKVASVFNKSSLSASQFIRSPIFNLSTSVQSFNKSLNLTVVIDFLLNSKGNDYCLAVLSKSRWECVGRPVITSQSQENSSTLNFLVKSNGVYAVIYNPDEDLHFEKAAVASTGECDWWCENKGTVLGVLIGFIVSVLVLGVLVYAYLKYSSKGVKGDRLLSEQDERKLDELNKQLSQKDKIIQETTQECNNSKEQNIKLTHEIENLQAEIDKLKAQAVNQE